VDGTGGTAPSKMSFKGLGLTRPVEYQGSAETVGTKTLIDNEAIWTDNQFNGGNGAFFVEITSGPGAGTTYDVEATTASTKTITLTQNLATGVASGATFRIRKHWTLASVFGAANESGLSGGSSTTADQVLIWNGTDHDVYYFQTSGDGGVGWRKAGAPTVDVAKVAIYPEDGLVIKRQQSTAANIVLMGAVKMGQSSVPISTGTNFIGNVFAAPLTLQSSGIYTANSATGLAGGSVKSADQLLLWNGTGYDVFYYQTAGIGGTGWRKAGAPTVDASSTPIPVGASFVVKRNASTAFDWVIPQHPSTL
jgi:uncharacterized protein (TIGR02597 family)